MVNKKRDDGEKRCFTAEIVKKIDDNYGINLAGAHLTGSKTLLSKLKLKEVLDLEEGATITLNDGTEIVVKEIIEVFQEEKESSAATTEKEDKRESEEATFDIEKSNEKTKVPKFEKDNYRIDKELSVEEKMKNGWKKYKIDKSYVSGIIADLTVIRKKVGEGSFVREFIDDGEIPKHLVGEQFFNQSAAEIYSKNRKLPSEEQLEKIRGGKGNHENFLKESFQKDGENMFSGYFDGQKMSFHKVNSVAYCWLLDGKHMAIDDREDYISIKETLSDDYAFPLRFLED